MLCCISKEREFKTDDTIPISLPQRIKGRFRSLPMARLLTKEKALPWLYRWAMAPQCCEQPFVSRLCIWSQHSTVCLLPLRIKYHIDSIYIWFVIFFLSSEFVYWSPITMSPITRYVSPYTTKTCLYFYWNLSTTSNSDCKYQTREKMRTLFWLFSGATPSHHLVLMLSYHSTINVRTYPLPPTHYYIVSPVYTLNTHKI